MSWLGELSDFGPAPLAVDVYWESYPGKKAHIWRLWQQSGWLQVARVSLETSVSSHEEVITLFCNDMGQPMPAWLGNRLFDMRSSVPSYMHHEPPEELEDQADALYWDFLGRCDQKNLKELARSEEALFADISKTEDKALAGVTDIDRYIGSLRRERRHPNCTAVRKAEIDVRINDVAQYKPELLAAIPEEVNKLRKTYQGFEQDTFDSLTYHGRIETLYTVRWTMCSRHQPPPVNVSLWTEERFARNLNVGTKWKAQMDSLSSTKKRTHKIAPIHFSPLDDKRTTLTLEKSACSIEPDEKMISSIEDVPEKPAWEHSLKKRRKRETRQQLSTILNKHGTLAELKYVRAFLKGKTGADLKAALIHLAKQDFMSPDDAVYLFMVLSALNAKKSN